MENASKETVEALNRLLADSYTTYLKSHSYHWNVTGPMFMTLHGLFENQYSELATAIDEIAERIRTLGAIAPGSFSQFEGLSTVKEDTGVPPALEMVKQLAMDQKTIADTARQVVKAAEEAGDDATVDLGVRRIDVHEKNHWMLVSHLE